MFIFGHVGITLGVGVALTGIIHTFRRETYSQEMAWQPEIGTTNLTKTSRAAFQLASWIESLGRFMDIRLLVIGSMLPDLIDKPISITLFGNGRVFTHSLSVSSLITVVAIYLFLKYRWTWLLAIAAGMISHLILDSMWLSPDIFYWPLYGWTFPNGIRINYLDTWLDTLMHNHTVMTFEGIGLIITMGISWYLIKQKKFIFLLIRGKI